MPCIGSAFHETAALKCLTNIAVAKTTLRGCKSNTGLVYRKITIWHMATPVIMTSECNRCNH